MREVRSNETEILLYDRVILRRECSDEFKKRTVEWLNTGIKAMSLDNLDIVPFYCSTINKHTCIEHINNFPNSFFVVLI